MEHKHIKFSNRNGAFFKLMMERTGIASPDELLKESLMQMYWSLKEINEGRTIVSLDEQTLKYQEYRADYIQRAMDKAKRAGAPTEEFHSAELERLIADLDPDRPKNKEEGRGR